MRLRNEALALVAGGVLLLALGFYLPSNPRAPFSLGGIPRLFYTGIAAGYVVGGGTAYVLSRSDHPPEFDRLFRGTLLAIPLAFVLSVALTNHEIGGVFNVQRFLALHLGIAVLFYPLVFGLVFGFGTEARDRMLVRVLVLSSLTVVVLIFLFAPSSGIGAAFAFLGVFAIAIVDVVFAYPLYRLGRELSPDTTVG